MISHGSLSARCIATVGLGNALRAGDPPGRAAVQQAVRAGVAGWLEEQR